MQTTITEEEGKLVTKQSGKPRDVCVIRELDGDMLKAVSRHDMKTYMEALRLYHFI